MSNIALNCFQCIIHYHDVHDESLALNARMNIVVPKTQTSSHRFRWLQQTAYLRGGP